MIKVGDKVKKKIHYGAEGGGMLPPEEGTVVYVHPRGLYYTVEFTFESRHGMTTLRESYPWKTREIVETAESDIGKRLYGPRLPGNKKQPTYYANYLESDQAKHKK